MLDEQDQGTRIGVGVAVSMALLVTIGMSLWLAVRGGAKTPSASTSAQAVQAAAAPAMTTTVAPSLEDAFVDVALTGNVLGTVYFAVGKAELPSDAGVAIAAIKQAAGASPDKKLLISGFHDASGDPVKNAELAKNRAKAMRAALQAEGIAPERTVMRKPESTTGDGNAQEARRVEVRLAE
jgi:outer membrane protein OmpA-like peptidoglycan-associated protein